MSRDGFLAGLGCSLIAGLILGLVDGVTAGAIPAVLGLWALPVLGFGLYAGAVAAGVIGVLGPRPASVLRNDRDLDAGIAGALLAAIVLLFLLSKVLGPPLKLLVIKAQRKEAGATLYPVVAAFAVVGLALLTIPLQRGFRLLTGAVPRLGPVPHTITVSVLAGIALLEWAREKLYGAGFETKALPILALAQLTLLPILTFVIAALAYGPLVRLRERLPGRALAVSGGAALALVLGVQALRAQPSAETATAVSNDGGASRLIVMVGQAALDRDGDGYSAFFRGPDCNDRNPGIHPSAKEIAGNGVDENCAYGDATTDAAAGPAPVTDQPAPAAPTGPKRNVLVIMVDTLRVDRIGANGYRRDGASISPRLDDFLAKSVWFRHAYANANNTPRSMPSFMTSRYPSQVAVDKLYAKYPRLKDENEMLFERLQAAGWHTIGVASHFYFRDERNFTQGFDEFDNEGALDIAPSNKDVASPRIVPKVEAKLAAFGKQPGKPFAMFVHLFEPHSSWVEHAGMPPITEKGSKAHGQRYDYEVKFVDGWIGKILDAVEREGLADDTIVVIMSDHGESFGDHSFAGESFFHGTNLYDEQIRVPLAFRVPGAAGRPVDAVVQLIDLAPTILDLVGAAPSPTWMGRSLAPAIRGEVLPPKPVFAELIAYPGWDHDIKIAVSGDGAWKLHDILSQRRQELYELATDPKESRDRWNDPAAKAKRDEMTQLMASFVDGVLSR